MSKTLEYQHAININDRWKQRFKFIDITADSKEDVDVARVYNIDHVKIFMQILVL